MTLVIASFLKGMILAMHNHHHIARRSIFHAAGWLFADLLLALAIIFIAASTTGSE
jgi:hypothetical protein